MKRKLLSVLILVSLSFYVSCTSVTEISGTWKKPATAAKKYSKIMVMALSGDVVKRATVENAIVQKLRAYGINAVSGTNVLPENFTDANSDGKMDSEKREFISTKLKEQGVDGAFMISLLDVKETERYIPGNTYYQPSTVYYPFYNYYYTTYNAVHTPGYYTKSTNVFLASNFYDMSNDELLWSSQSETINPQSLSDFTKSYSAAVTQDFINSGIVKR